jgi:hypothetical protein
MNNTTKAAFYTLFLLLGLSFIVSIMLRYPEQSKLVLMPIFAIGGVLWLYKLVLYIIESK